MGSGNNNPYLMTKTGDIIECKPDHDVPFLIPATASPRDLFRPSQEVSSQNPGGARAAGGEQPPSQDPIPVEVPSSSPPAPVEPSPVDIGEMLADEVPAPPPPLLR